MFVVSSVFLTKLVTLGISFSRAGRALVVAKLVILGISPLTSFILALRVVLVAISTEISGILSSIFFYLSIIYIFFTDFLFKYIAQFT